MVQNCRFYIYKKKSQKIILALTYLLPTLWFLFQVEIKTKCFWKCWLSLSNRPNKQIKPHSTRWHYPLIPYLRSSTRPASNQRAWKWNDLPKANEAMIARKAKPFVNISTTTSSCASKFCLFFNPIRFCLWILMYNWCGYKKGTCALNNVKAVVKFHPTGFKLCVSLNMTVSMETRDSRTGGSWGACHSIYIRTVYS